MGRKPTLIKTIPGCRAGRTRNVATRSTKAAVMAAFFMIQRNILKISCVLKNYSFNLQCLCTCRYLTIKKKFDLVRWMGCTPETLRGF